GGNLVSETEQTEHRDRAGDRETNPPPTRRRLFDDAGNAFRDPAEVAFVQHQRWTLDPGFRGRCGLALDHICGCVIHQLTKIDILTSSPPNRRRQCCPRPAFSDSDYEFVRDNSSAYSRSNIRA